MTEDVRRKMEAWQDEVRKVNRNRILTEEEQKEIIEARKVAEDIAELHHDKTRPIYITDEFIEKSDENTLLAWLVLSKKKIVDMYEEQEGWTERQKMDMVAHDFANMGYSLVKALIEERKKSK